MTKDNINTVEMTKLLEQEEDTAGRSGHSHQYLKLETVDNGAGSYIVIGTERWAIDDREEWIKIWDKHIEPLLKEVNKD
jgi:hypothetical protein